MRRSSYAFIMSLESIDLATLSSGKFCWTGDYCPLKFNIPCDSLFSLYTADEYSVVESISFKSDNGERRVQNWADRRGSGCTDGFGTLAQVTSEYAPFFKPIAEGGEGIRFDGKSWLSGSMRTSIPSTDELTLVFAGIPSTVSSTSSTNSTSTRPIFSFRGDDKLDAEVLSTPFGYASTTDLKTVTNTSISFTSSTKAYSIVIDASTTAYYVDGVITSSQQNAGSPAFTSATGILDLGCRLALNIAKDGSGNSITSHEDSVALSAPCFEGTLLGFAAYSRALGDDELIAVGKALSGEVDLTIRAPCSELSAPLHGSMEKVANSYGEVDKEGSTILFKCATTSSSDDADADATEYVWQTSFPQSTSCNIYGKWPGYETGIVPACVDADTLDILEGRKIISVDDLLAVDVMADLAASIAANSSDPTLGGGRGYGLDANDTSPIVGFALDTDGSLIVVTEEMMETGNYVLIDHPDVASSGCAAVRKFHDMSLVTARNTICDAAHTFNNSTSLLAQIGVNSTAQLGLPNPVYEYQIVTVICAASCILPFTAEQLAAAAAQEAADAQAAEDAALAAEAAPYGVSADGYVLDASGNSTSTTFSSSLEAVMAKKASEAAAAAAAQNAALDAIDNQNYYDVTANMTTNELWSRVASLVNNASDSILAGLPASRVETFVPLSPESCSNEPDNFIGPGYATQRGSYGAIPYTTGGESSASAVLICDVKKDYSPYGSQASSEAISCTNDVWQRPTTLRCMRTCNAWNNTTPIIQSGMISDGTAPTEVAPGTTTPAKCGTGYLSAAAMTSMRSGTTIASSLLSEKAICYDSEWKTMTAAAVEPSPIVTSTNSTSSTTTSTGYDFIGGLECYGVGALSVGSNHGDVVQSSPGTVTLPTKTGSGSSDPVTFTMTISSEYEANRWYRYVKTGVNTLRDSGLPSPTHPVSFYSDNYNRGIIEPLKSDLVWAQYMATKATPLYSNKVHEFNVQIEANNTMFANSTTSTTATQASTSSTLLQISASTRRAFAHATKQNSKASSFYSRTKNYRSLSASTSSAVTSSSSSSTNSTSNSTDPVVASSDTQLKNTYITEENIIPPPRVSVREYNVTNYAKEARGTVNQPTVFDVGCRVDVSRAFAMNSKTEHTAELHLSSSFASLSSCFKGFITTLALWRRELSKTEVDEWQTLNRKIVSLANSKALSKLFINDNISEGLRRAMVGLFIANDAFFDFDVAYIPSTNSATTKPIKKWSNALFQPGSGYVPPYAVNDTNSTASTANMTSDELAEASLNDASWIDSLIQTRTQSQPLFVDGQGVYFDGMDDYMVSASALRLYSNGYGLTISTQASTSQAGGVPQVLVQLPTPNAAATVLTTEKEFECTLLGPELAFGIDLGEFETSKINKCELYNRGFDFSTPTDVLSHHSFVNGTNLTAPSTVSSILSSVFIQLKKSKVVKKHSAPTMHAASISSTGAMKQEKVSAVKENVKIHHNKHATKKSSHVSADENNNKHSKKQTKKVVDDDQSNFISKSDSVVHSKKVVESSKNTQSKQKHSHKKHSPNKQESESLTSQQAQDEDHKESMIQQAEHFLSTLSPEKRSKYAKEIDAVTSMYKTGEHDNDDFMQMFRNAREEMKGVMMHNPVEALKEITSNDAKTASNNSPASRSNSAQTASAERRARIAEEKRIAAENKSSQHRDSIDSNEDDSAFVEVKSQGSSEDKDSAAGYDMLLQAREIYKQTVKNRSHHTFSGEY